MWTDLSALAKVAGTVYDDAAALKAAYGPTTVVETGVRRRCVLIRA